MHFEEIERRLNCLIRAEKRLPEIDISNCLELVEHREYGVAFEIFCTQIDEYDLSITQESIAELAAIGSAMLIDPKYWERLIAQ